MTPPTHSNETPEGPPPQTSTSNQDDYTRHSRRSRFRFKSSSSSSRRKPHASQDRDRDRHDLHERHRQKRRKRRHSPQPQSHYVPNHSHSHSQDDAAAHLSAEAAFRESLFDAMCDDEGAAYWEGVYGQPIHNYGVPRGPDGALERMTEDEYATYVRTKMWERTREGMLEEQERLRAERARHKQREKRAEEDARERRAFEKAMEESLRRGEQRRRGRAWRGVWEGYLRSWEGVDAIVKGQRGEGKGKGQALRDLIFWPVESGKRRDVTRAAVAEFMRAAPAAAMEDLDLVATLKAERVRWHPDKIQHRYGALGIDEGVMRSVTEVFQIVDEMWSEVRDKQA